MMRLIIPMPYLECSDCGHRIELDHDDRWPDIAAAEAEHAAECCGPPAHHPPLPDTEETDHA